MNDKQLMLALFAQLQREKMVSIPQLAKLLGCDEQRVEDALEKLVHVYDSVSLYLDLRGTYARLVDYGTERILRLTAAETGVLLDALESQGIDSDGELARKLVETKGLFGDDAVARVRTVHMSANASLVETLAASCEDEEHHLLQIDYRKDGDDRPRSRIVEPLELSSDGAHTALEAYCRQAKGWRTFRLDRIRTARTLDDTFTPRKDRPPRKTGKLSGQQQARIRLSADTPLPTWPGLRKKRPATDGAVECTVPWTGSAWLPKQLAATFGAAVPLDPPELVEATRAYARQLLDEAQRVASES